MTRHERLKSSLRFKFWEVASFDHLGRPSPHPLAEPRLVLPAGRLDPRPQLDPPAPGPAARPGDRPMIAPADRPVLAGLDAGSLCSGIGALDLAARALGRVGIGVDLRFDYCRVARWRSFDSAQAAKPLTRTWAERQGGLFDHRGGGR